MFGPRITVDPGSDPERAEEMSTQVRRSPEHRREIFRRRLNRAQRQAGIIWATRNERATPARMLVNLDSGGYHNALSSKHPHATPEALANLAARRPL